MARDSEEQRKIKIKALYESIAILKEESSPTSNLVTFDKVVSLANELFGVELHRNISPTSIKTPSSKEFEEIKAIITECREEYKKTKTAVPKKAFEEVAKLKLQIENLTSEVVKFFDYKQQLHDKLEAKENTISKQYAEINNLRKEVDRLRGLN